MTQLVILGASGHGSVVADAAVMMRRWSEIVFLDDDPNLGTKVLGFSVEGSVENWVRFNRKSVDFFVAVGRNAARLDLLAEIKNSKGRLATVIHPSATISRFTELGDGVLVCAGSVINPRTTIKHGAIINTGATVDHDCVVGQAAHISPGAHLAGGVKIGDRSWMGIGSSVREGVTIGDDVIVGAGAAVVSDVPANSTVVGVPARPIK